ncbi:hypothetical protein [Bdellovibrio bacteriovorus]|uniref:hypothetical protein n=1 Tax=Bdellovibrio TaxID=958 RepID=UPI0035A9A97A
MKGLFYAITLVQLIALSGRSQTLQKETVQIELGYKAIVQELFNRRQDLLNKTFETDYAYCTRTGSNVDMRDAKKQYFCDEYPYGETILGEKNSAQWSAWKRLVNVPVKYKDKKGERTLRFDIRMSRSQRSGKVPRSILEYKAPVTLQTTKNWIGNWTVQLIPKNNNIYASVCTVMPGFIVDAPNVDGKYTFFKKWKVSLSVNYTIDPGRIQFDVLDVCGLLKIYLDKNMNPQYELVALDRPRLINAKLEKPKLKIKDKWAKVLLSIYKLFTKKTVDSMVNSYLKDYIPTEQEMEDGTWMKRIPNGMLKAKFVDNFKGMVDSLNKNKSNDSAQTFDVTRTLEDQCARLSAQVPRPELHELIRTYCAKAVKEAQLKASPFVRHTPSSNSKCYEMPFMLDTAQVPYIDRAWWSEYEGQSWAFKEQTDTGCRLIGARISGYFKKEMGQLVKCAAVEANVAINKRNRVFDNKACSQEVRILALSLLEEYLKEKYGLDGRLLTAFEQLKGLLNQILQTKNKAEIKNLVKNFIEEYKDSPDVKEALKKLDNLAQSENVAEIVKDLKIQGEPLIAAYPELADLSKNDPAFLPTIAIVQLLNYTQGLGLGL